ncbi:MAG: hypothetical protein OEY88_04100 [Candidatus Bathyarchaeota archaeon]|nr:hypothetical protein [Candidatus Bathyarchaeota archaeon]
MPRAVNELKAWRVAILILATLAITVFCVQRFVIQIFDIPFEVCIFYVPTAMVILFVFLLSIKNGRLL